MYTLFVADFASDATLKAKVSNRIVSNALLHLYRDRFLHVGARSKFFKLRVFKSVRLINDLFARCNSSFKGEAKYDRVSIEAVKRYKRAGTGGEIWFGEIHCLVEIIYPKNVHRPREKVVVVRYIEEVARVRDWVREKRPHASAEMKKYFSDLEIKYKKNFDRLNVIKPNGQKNKLTDGTLSLGRPYLMWQPDEMHGTNPYAVLSIDTLFKPEHLIQDRQLRDDKDCAHPCFYVQNTITYFSNLTLTS